MPARKPRRRSGKPQEARSGETPYSGIPPLLRGRLKGSRSATEALLCSPEPRLTRERLLDVLLSDLRLYYRDEEGCRPQVEEGWAVQLLLRAEAAIQHDTDRILRRKYLTALMVTALGWMIEEGADRE